MDPPVKNAPTPQSSPQIPPPGRWSPVTHIHKVNTQCQNKGKTTRHLINCVQLCILDCKQPSREKHGDEVTHVVILGSADRGFNSVQMWLNGLHVRWVLASTHLENQLNVNTRAINHITPDLLHYSPGSRTFLSNTGL